MAPVSLLSYARVYSKRTISTNLANAGSNVGGASRCRSMPSNTKTNFRRFSSSVWRCAANALMFSHRTYGERSKFVSEYASNASRHDATVLSRR